MGFSYLLVAKNWNPGATSMQSSLPGIISFLFSIKGRSTEIYKENQLRPLGVGNRYLKSSVIYGDISQIKNIFPLDCCAWLSCNVSACSPWEDSPFLLQHIDIKGKTFILKCIWNVFWDVLSKTGWVPTSCIIMEQMQTSFNTDQITSKVPPHLRVKVWMSDLGANCHFEDL